MATSHHFPASSNQHDHHVKLTTWAAVTFMAVTWMWIHHTASTGPQDAPLDAPALAARPVPSMPVWLAQSEPLLDGLVTARNDIAAAAARKDLPATGAACQTATDAVESLHEQLPTPEPELTNTLQHLLSSYDRGLPYCISASKSQDSDGMVKAAGYMAEGDTAMRTAIDMLEAKPIGQGVLIV